MSSDTATAEPAATLSSPSISPDSALMLSSALPAPPAPRLLDASHPRFAALAASLKDISTECGSELREELRARKPDVGAVRDLLRFHLGRQLEIAAELGTIAEKDAAAEEIKPTAAASSSASPTTDAPVAPSIAPYSLPDSMLRAHPLIPSSLRGQVWALLLGSYNKDQTLLDGFDADKITAQPRAPSALRPLGVDEDEEAQNATAGVMTASLRASIRMDAQRTRHSMHSNTQLVGELETLLVFYCHSRSVAYKQGLNEILAPILITMSAPATGSPSSLAASDDLASFLSTNAPLVVPRGSVYNAFYALISKFLPGIFTDSDLENLRCIFRLFRLLFTYHAPRLAHYVEAESGVVGEMYATSWFLTLWSSGSCTDSLATLQRIWDAVLAEDDPFLHYFLALALLRSNDAYLRSTPAKYLPMALRKLQITSENLLALIVDAKQLRSATPTSFRQSLFEVSFAKTNTSLIQKLVPAAASAAATSAVGPASAAPAASPNGSPAHAVPSAALSTHLLEQLASYNDLLPCMSVPASEVVSQAYSDLESQQPRAAASSSNSGATEGQIKYIVLDCRPTSEFAAGHLPCAIHLSPSLLHIPSQLSALVGPKQYGGMRECHFVFVGSQVASFAEVQTPLMAGAAAGGPAAHALNLPTSRRPVPPPSPSSSLAALAVVARAEEDAIQRAHLLANSVPLKHLNPHQAADSGDATPVLGGTSSAGSMSFPQAHALTVDVDSPLSSNGATSASAAQSASPSSSSGVLYRPETPGRSPQLGSPLVDGTSAASSSFICTSPVLDAATASYIRWFLSHGFAHVSVCEGGFPACHALVLRAQAAYHAQRRAIAAGEALSAYQAPLENMELVDHNAKACVVCNPPAVVTPTAEAVAVAAIDHSPAVSSTPPPSSSDASKSESKSAAAKSSKVLSATDAYAAAAAGAADSPLKKHSSAAAAGDPSTPNKGDEKANGADSKASAAKEPKDSTPAKDASSSDKDAASTAAASSEKEKGPSSFSKFSLGFKKLGASLSDKLAKFKEESAEKDRLKAIEKEREAAEKKVAAEKAAADKAEKERIKAEQEKEKAEQAALDALESDEPLTEEEASKSSSKPDASAKDKESAKDKSKASSKDGAPKEGTLGSRFLSALGIHKGGKKPKHISDAPVSEMNAAIDLNDWAHDGENIALFHCHEISLFPAPPRAAPATPVSSSAPSTPPPTAPAAKRQGLLLPRVLAVTAGYVIVFQPAQAPVAAATAAAIAAVGGGVSVLPSAPAVVRSTSSATDAAVAAEVTASAGASFGLAYLKAKHRLIDLDKITSKKDRPSVLTFHWKSPDAAAAVADPAPSTPATPSASLMQMHAVSLSSPASTPSSSNEANEAATPSSSFMPHAYPSPAASPSAAAAAAGSARKSAGAATASPRGPSTMFLVDRPKDCIALVRAKFLLAKASAALADSNRQVQTQVAAADSVPPVQPALAPVDEEAAPASAAPAAAAAATAASASGSARLSAEMAPTSPMAAAAAAPASASAPHDSIGAVEVASPSVSAAAPARLSPAASPSSSVAAPLSPAAAAPRISSDARSPPASALSPSSAAADANDDLLDL